MKHVIAGVCFALCLVTISEAGAMKARTPNKTFGEHNTSLVDRIDRRETARAIHLKELPDVSIPLLFKWKTNGGHFDRAMWLPKAVAFHHEFGLATQHIPGHMDMRGTNTAFAINIVDEATDDAATRAQVIEAMTKLKDIETRLSDLDIMVWQPDSYPKLDIEKLKRDLSSHPPIAAE